MTPRPSPPQADVELVGEVRGFLPANSLYAHAALDALAARLTETETRLAREKEWGHGVSEALTDAATAADAAKRRVAELEAAAERVVAADNQSLGMEGDEGWRAMNEMIDALSELRAALDPAPSQHAEPDQQAALTGEDPPPDREKD